MDSLKNYLDGVFMRFPKTESNIEIKDNLLREMKLMKNSLIKEGKTEKEALGIVFAEYSDIESRIFGYNGYAAKETETRTVQTFRRQDAEEYISLKKLTSLLISLGVFLCIAGIASLIFVSILIDGQILNFEAIKSPRILGVILLFVFIAAAVALFIYSGVRLERYEYLKRDGFVLEKDFEDEIKERKDSFEKTYILSLIAGVGLCVLSPLCLFIPTIVNQDFNGLEVALMLLVISVAVFVLTYYGNIRDGYNFLLKLGEYRYLKKPEDQFLSIVSGLLWPVATIIFLLLGFIWNLWHKAWISFAIAGIINGGISAVYKASKGIRD